MKTGSNLAIFVLFFGVAVLEAFYTRNWLAVTFWLVIAATFGWLSRRKGSSTSADQ